MTSKAAELRSKGFKVINMSVGEPDFNTPLNIRNAGIDAINNGMTKYTPGGKAYFVYLFSKAGVKNVTIQKEINFEKMYAERKGS